MGRTGTLEASQAGYWHMSEHQKQTAFFKAMVEQEDSHEHRELTERILKAERDERCVRRAIIKIILLMAMSFIGCLHTLVMMPEVIFESNHSMRKVFQILALGSIMSLATYVGFWFYFRALLFQVHGDCRRFLMSKSVGVVHREEVPSSEHSSRMGWTPVHS